MNRNRLAPLLVLLPLHLLAPATAQEERAETVPSDLRPLLTPRQSGMRIVAERYQADRAQLDRFYRAPLSSAHLARLRRFDLDWSAALDELGGLDAGAARELDELRATIRANVAELEAAAGAQARIAPLAPFAEAIHELLDARRKVEPMDAENAAQTLASIAREVERSRAAVESGALDVAGIAALAADTVGRLQRAVRVWFGFYDGYDPLFSWWAAAPFAEVDAALPAYAALLRERAKTDEATTPPAVTVEPAAAPPISDVPDLAGLLATPQNEMAGVLRAYRGGGRGAGRRGGRGGARGAAAGRGGRGDRGNRRGGRAQPRSEQFYAGWRDALESLDFDQLSRPAQVTYLGFRNDLDVALLRRRTPAQENIPRVPDDSGIEGRPIGETALRLALADELIPYTPAEIIAIGDAEYAWCMREMLAASRELGFGDDWRKALERVKTLHVRPGEQPVMIRELMFEAVDFLREHDLITVSQIASETLRMGMMSPQRQLVNPFFTGGALISVSFPTDTMSHDAKLQSMRGNNIPFARATVHHELIPGHNLQRFVNARYAAYRAGGRNTPFYGEGWAVYWEMQLYRMGFPRIAAERTGFPNDAENRIGFLFWRMHRSARITFSLRFHMGEWSAQQCIDFLVDGVGHERENAIAEVRRSFAGSYGPLYQAGYLLGAVQFRKLREELVESGLMPEKEFHDRILRAGAMPVALVRLLLNGEKLSRDMPLDWKFYGDTIPARRD